MAKPKLVRIANRGSFPRWRLESVGSSSKRGRMDDPSQGGWFGSGTKIAPVAALALGMEVWVTSTDAEGAYLVSYGVLPRERDGEDDSRVVRRWHHPDGSFRTELTEFSPGAFPNWSKPIGDDDKREFRVWREYFRNAHDADAEAPALREVDAAELLKPDVTAIYLTHTVEYAAIVEDVDRYFKYLSGDRPSFGLPGVGHIWPKSQSGVTRLFSLGTLAFCDACTRINWSTLHDYSFDEKSLMSEERTFENLTKVQGELAKLLCALDNPTMLEELLRAMLDGRAELERLALSLVGSGWPIPAKARWKEAWETVHGKQTVIAKGDWSDQSARCSYGMEPVTVTSYGLKAFLKHCGVRDSLDLLPTGDRLGYRVVEPTAEERAMLDRARRVLSRHRLDVADISIRVYEALDMVTAKYARGFCQPTRPPFKEVYIRREELADIESALGTLNHEMRHVRTGALDGTHEFMDRADEDLAALLLELEREDDELVWNFAWREDTHVDPEPEPDLGPELPPIPPVPQKR